MRRVFLLLLLGIAGCAQAQNPTKERDLSIAIQPDFSLQDGGPSGSTDLACAKLAQPFMAVPSGWLLQGSAVIDTQEKRVQLTNDVEDRAGSAFAVTPVPVSYFEAQWKYYIGGGGGGHGLAFVLAKAGAVTELAPKGTGNTIGYQGMTGYALEFDSEAGGTGDPDGNHVAWVKAATGQHLAVAASPLPISCGCERQAKVRYDGTKLTVTLDTTVVLDGPIGELTPDTYYVGFTAATGAAEDVHAIRDFKLAVGAIGSGCVP